MATSTIYLWKGTGLTPSLNYSIDRISDYLGTQDLLINNFQFVDFKPKMSIRLNLDQYNLQYNADYAYDYCYIDRSLVGEDSDDDDAGAYFFVTGMKWLSKNCIEFQLEMDVLNTFTWNDDYVVTDKTLIKREHKNRFSSVTNFNYYSDVIRITGGVTKTVRIENGLIKNARIKSVGTVTIITGTSVTATATFNNYSHYIEVSLYSAIGQDVKFSFVYQVYAYIANIDLKSEGIQAPLYKQNDIYLPDQSGVSWSLLYRNQNDYDPSNPDDFTMNNPVECYLFPSEQLKVMAPSSSNELNKNNVPSDKWAVVFAVYNSPVPTFTYVNNNNNTVNFTPGYATAVDDEYVYAIAFKASANGVQVQTITAAYSPYVGSWWGSWAVSATEVATIAISGSLSSLKYYPVSSLPNVTWIASNYNNPVYATGTISLNALSAVTLLDKNTIDRTDPKNIKLITLPYAPTDVSVDRGTSKLTVGSEWYFNSTDGSLKLIDLNTKFKNTLRNTDITHLIGDLVFNTYHVTLDGTAMRDNIDPKLYHSDFYYKKFVYDSFSKIFKLELYDWDASLRANSEPYFTPDFYMTRNITSKFLFMFPQYKLYFGEEDYDDTMPVARNNEEVLYNNQYLNYLRAGYNYDLKSKERQESAGAAGIGVSIASLIGSIALTASGYGTAIGVAGIVGSVAGIAGSLINYAKTTAQSEDNIQRKLLETQNQATSVLNADDFDLLEAYSGNKAKMCTYEVSVQMRDALSDLFHYCGYSTNEHDVPDITTRYWFNFVQCDLVCDYWQNISKEIQELIKNKFSEGVTFFHCHKLGSDTFYTWDIAQERENYEKWIVLANGGAQ